MRSVILQISLLVLGLKAHASTLVELYFVPSTVQSLQKTEMMLAQNQLILKARPVFTQVERSQLRGTTLQQSFVVSALEGSLPQLMKQQTELGGTLELSEIELQTAQEAEPLSQLQWGLKNTGSPQSIELDLINNYRLLGQSSFDVQFPALDDKAVKGPVIVAVLDTGIDKTHPDLQSVLVRKEAECEQLEKFKTCLKDQSRENCEKIYMDLSNPQVDTDHNGYPMDCEGWSLLGGKNQADILGRPDFGDEQGHGTHVAGIIAASTHNKLGISGASSHVRLLPIQVLGKNPNEPIKPLSQGNTLDFDQFEKGKESYQKTLGDMVARGVIYAIKSGAKVLNFSLGWPQSRDSEFLRQVIRWAQQQGAVIVAAAGNDSTQALLRPCAYSEVVCVAAHGPEGTLAYFSNYGTGVDIAAPGVNILSTYPMQKRNVRFRDFSGYEYLHGTSQASPFVAAAFAELLSLGMDRDEAYARMMIGARPLNVSYSVQKVGPQKQVVVQTQIEERKYVLSGALNLTRALELPAQALVLPLEKDRLVINWDRVQTKFTYKIKLKNYWSDFEFEDPRTQIEYLKAAESLVGVQVVASNWSVSSSNIWKKSEVRELELTVELLGDDKSRLASELEFNVQLFNGDQKISDFISEVELISAVGPSIQGSDIEKFQLPKLPAGRVSLIPVDERYAGSLEQVDYLVANYKSPKWEYNLLRQNGSTYEILGNFKFKPPEKNENLREQVVSRLDLQNDGQVDYVLGLYNETEGEEALATLDFFEFDSKWQKLTEYSINSKTVAVPLKVYWMWNQSRKVISWVGEGLDPARKETLLDIWSKQTESPKRRFYYLNEDGKLNAIEKYQDFEFVDILEPSQQDVVQGTVPVVMAKNLGTKLKPSYLYEYAFAKIRKGKVEAFEVVQQQNYLDIVSTRVDSVRNLDATDEMNNGKFWFGKGAQNSQSISMWRGKEFSEFRLPPRRKLVDAALWVRSVYAGQNRKGAFVFTNSELQYHDLKTGQVVSRSLNKYSFYGDNIFTSLHFPLVVGDQASSQLLPAIYTTETSGLNSGVKIVVPLFAISGEVEGLVTPARLRFRADTGCKPLDSTVFRGKNMGDSLDYFCQSQLIRIKLTF